MSRPRSPSSSRLAAALCLVAAACAVPDADFTGIDDGGEDVDATDAPPGSLALVVSATSLTVEESAEAGFTVALSQPPPGAVIVTVESSDDDVLGTRPAVLVFDTATWDTTQTVTISGKPDVDALDDAGSVTLSSSAAGDASVAVTVNDDDAFEVVTTPADAVEVDEGNTTAVAVRLSALPTGDVVVEVGSLDPAVAAVAPGTLTFGVDDWNLPQDVLVTGVQDDDTISQGTTISLASPGSPDVDGATLAVTVADDDILGIVPSLTNLGTLIEGGSTSFTARLSHPPAADVDVSVVSSDGTALTTSPALLHFTPTTWSVPQPITVNAVADADVTDETVTITLSAAGLTSRVVAAALDDDDVQDLIVAPVAVTTLENLTAPFSVRLAHQPAAPVTVAVSSLATSVATVTPATLVFTASDYDDPQTAIVRGTDDQDAVPGSTAVRVESVVAGIARDVPVTVTDDDDLTIETDMAAVSLMETTTATFQVRLTAAPVGSLTVVPVSGDVSAATAGPAALTFTTANWNAYQTVTVTGVNDADTAPDAVMISLSSTATPSVVVTANVGDDDVLVILPGATTLPVTEGLTATLEVQLSHQPASNVVVTATSSATTAVTVAPFSVTFTPLNYATVQHLTVTGAQDDDAVAGSATITLAATGVSAVAVDVTVAEDDTVEIDLALTSLSIVEGSSGAIGVRLQAQPAANVTVNVASSDVGAATATPATLTFTPSTWNTYQPVTVAGVADPDIAPESVTLSFAGPGLITRTAMVVVTDDDELGVVTSAGAVSLGEAGSATFQVRLSLVPGGTTTVTVASNDTGAATASPASLSFTPSTWNTYQTVTVTGVADADLAAESVTIGLTGAGIIPGSVSASVTDDDTQVVVATPSSLTVAEGGIGTVGVRLQYQPAASVVVTASSASTAVATVSPATLTFTPANYATLQNLTVAGAEDPDATPGATTVTMSSPGAMSASASITVNDNDPLDIATSVPSLLVGEVGTGMVGVRLTAQPAANVVVNVGSSDPGAATVAPATLTFTPATWDTYQNVTVTGIDDADAADESVTVTCSGSGVTPRTMTVTVDDDDSLTIVASATSVSLAENGTATFQVHLGAQPPATTAVAVASADLGAATVSPATLSFTTATWNAIQTVTITGVDDVDMVAESVAISLSSAGLATVSVTAAVTDPDTQQVVAVPGTLPVTEGLTGSVAVHLAYQPAASTTVTVTLDAAIATASASSLTFTPANYAADQTLTITGTSDADGANDTTSLSLTSPSATAASVALTIEDDEVVGFTFNNPSYTVMEGATATVQVRLSAQPASSVIVTVTSTDTSSATVSPGSLTFTTANWNTYRTVTVTGVQDADTTNDHPDVRFAASGLTTLDIDGTAYDNDTITTDVDPVAVLEAGSGTLQVRLTAAPPSSVTVAIASSDTATATVSIASRTFTTSNWSTYQAVTVSGVNDSDTTNDTATISLTSSGYTTKAVVTTVHDNDTITREVSSLSVGEGDTAPLRVRLLAQPLANVLVSASLSDASVATFTPAALTFTPSNWNTYQNINVTGTNDADATNDSATMSLASPGMTTATATITALEYVTLTVAPYSDNGGSGTVTGTGINCGVPPSAATDCTERMLWNAAVDLHAAYPTGSWFWGWQNCNPWWAVDCTVNVIGSTTVTAHFPRVVNLTVTKIGNGNIKDNYANSLDCGSQCSWEYYYVASVTITATPDPGWVFSSWNGACAGQGAACSLTFSSNTTAQAVFVPQ